MFKISMIAAMMMTTTSAFAQPSGMGQLHQGAMAVYQTDGQLKSVDIQNGLVLNLNIQLRGCVDQLLLVNHNSTLDKNGNLVVDVSAVAEFNKASLTARCIVAPTKNAKLTIPGMTVPAENIIVHFLK